MLGVDHDKTILLSTPFQPSQCWEQIVGVMLLCSMLEINDVVLYCIVLYCIVLYCIVLYCIVLYCIVLYCIALCEAAITSFSGFKSFVIHTPFVVLLHFSTTLTFAL